MLNKEIAILILAAGSSSRLGHPKQLVQFEGKSLLRRTIETALDCQCKKIVTVLGANSELIKREINYPSVTVVENKDWKQGMGSSIAKGVETLEGDLQNLKAVLILVCDQPFVGTKLLQNLIKTHQEEKCLIVASSYKNTFGVPAIFGQTLFPDLQNLKDQKGAKQLMKANQEKLITIPFPKGHIDVDTPEDLESLK